MRSSISIFSTLGLGPHGFIFGLYPKRLHTNGDICPSLYTHDPSHFLSMWDFGCIPNTQKNEIEKIIKELLEVGVIHPRISPYSSPVVMVLKKDGELRMCLDFRALKKLMVKDKFPISVVEDLLDELNGAQFFTKLDLHLGYH